MTRIHADKTEIAAEEAAPPPQFDLRSLMWLTLLVGLSQVTDIYADWFAFFIATALAAWEAGFTPRGSFLKILLRNLGALYVSFLSFGAVGYGLMRGENPTGWFGTTEFVFGPIYADTDNVHESAHFFRYNFALCAATAIIASSSFAGRVRPAVYVVCWAIISLAIFPLFGSWGGGVLTHGWMGIFHDSYSATCVFAIGGWSALAGVVVFGRDWEQEDEAPAFHCSAPLAAGGLFLLWTLWKDHRDFFWLFGGGTSPSTLAVGRATVLGLVGGLAGSLVGAQQASVSLILKGGMAGLVSSAVFANHLGSFWASVCGCVAGLLGVGTALHLARRGIADPAGAVSSFVVGGVIGALGAGWFRHDYPYGIDMRNFENQLLGVNVACVWSFGVSFVVYSAVRRLFGERLYPAA